MDEENQVHGRIPQNMNSAYGSSDASFARARQHRGEHPRIDRELQQRVDEGPEEPEDRTAVTRLEVARDERLDEAAIAEERAEVLEH